MSERVRFCQLFLMTEGSFFLRSWIEFEADHYLVFRSSILKKIEGFWSIPKLILRMFVQKGAWGWGVEVWPFCQDKLVVLFQNEKIWRSAKSRGTDLFCFLKITRIWKILKSRGSSPAMASIWNLLSPRHWRWCLLS